MINLAIDYTEMMNDAQQFDQFEEATYSPHHPNPNNAQNNSDTPQTSNRTNNPTSTELSQNDDGHISLITNLSDNQPYFFDNNQPTLLPGSLLHSRQNTREATSEIHSTALHKQHSELLLFNEGEQHNVQAPNKTVNSPTNSAPSTEHFSWDFAPITLQQPINTTKESEKSSNKLQKINQNQPEIWEDDAYTNDKLSEIPAIIQSIQKKEENLIENEEKSQQQQFHFQENIRKQSDQFQFQEAQPAKEEQIKTKEETNNILDPSPLSYTGLNTMTLNMQKKNDFLKVNEEVFEFQEAPSKPIQISKEEKEIAKEERETVVVNESKKEQVVVQGEDQFGDFAQQQPQTVEQQQPNQIQTSIPQINVSGSNQVLIKEQYKIASPELHQKQKELQVLVDSLPDYSFILPKAFLILS